MKRMQRIQSWAATIGLALSILATPIATLPSNAAGNASISLSPSTGTYETGKTFTVTISINSGTTTINAAEVVVTYDSTRLSLQNVNNTSDPFTVDFPPTTGSGVVTIPSGILGANVTGSNTFAKLTFKATSTGSAQVQIANTSQVNADDAEGTDVWNGSQTSRTYTINKPVAVSSTPKSNTSESSNTTKKTTENTTTTETPPVSENTSVRQTVAPETLTSKPKATSVTKQPEVVKNTFKQTQINVGTSSVSQARILYGLGNEFKLATKKTGFATSHTIALNQENIIPGRTYRYKVELTDQSGKVTETKTQEFISRGYRILLNLRTQNGDPITNQLVDFNSDPRSAVTDETGQVVFNDVAAGKHTVSIADADGNTSSQEVLVVNNATGNETSIEDIPMQTADLVFVTASTGSNIVILSVGAAIGLLVMFIAALFGIRFLQRKQQELKAAEFTPPEPEVIRPDDVKPKDED